MQGIVLDTGILIRSERQRQSVDQLVNRTYATFGSVPLILAAVSGVELTHGMYRARTDAERDRRREFLNDAFSTIAFVALTLEIAQLAGQIEGEQAVKGIAIPFQDLLIGATALHLGFDVLTLNTKHFELIPGLTLHTL